MALSKASLKSALESLFQNPPATRADCAAAWAAAISDYSAGAISCQGASPENLGAREAILAAALTSAFSGSDPSTTAAAMDTALGVFWLGVVFPAGVPGAAAVPTPGLLSSGLVTMWAANVASSASYSDAAQGHADIFDLATKTVVVTHPAVCAAPIT